jgi:hypothetical protein
MESTHYFKIYYGNVYVLSVCAQTKWEAIERAYSKFMSDVPNLKREKFTAKK